MIAWGRDGKLRCDCVSKEGLKGVVIFNLIKKDNVVIAMCPSCEDALMISKINGLETFIKKDDVGDVMSAIEDGSGCGCGD